LEFLVDRDPDRLQVGALVERVDRLVATETGLLEAAERRRDVAAVEAVDPDDAGAKRARDAATDSIARPVAGLMQSKVSPEAAST
jgi:hypothetical protein